MIPKAVVRHKSSYGSGRAVYFVEYEYKGQRYITGTVIRGTNKSRGWYFGIGTDGLRTANNIALMNEREYVKAEEDNKYAWAIKRKSLS